MDNKNLCFSSIAAAAAAAAAKSLQSCLTLCDPIDGCPPGSRPWDSPGKNTGVGCHFLLQLDPAYLIQALHPEPFYVREAITDFPGGPAVKTLSSQCRGHWFNPWSEIPPAARLKNKQKKCLNDSGEDSVLSSQLCLLTVLTLEIFLYL